MWHEIVVDHLFGSLDCTLLTILEVPVTYSRLLTNLRGAAAGYDGYGLRGATRGYEGYEGL